MTTTRIFDMPVYEARTEQLEASLYNLWRRARLHIQLPLRIELPEKRQMVLIIEDDCWVLVDQNQYDLPILAWLDIQDAHRDSLHTAVNCTLNYYHYLASRLRKTSLDLLVDTLQEKLGKSNKTL